MHDLARIAAAPRASRAEWDAAVAAAARELDFLSVLLLMRAEPPGDGRRGPACYKAFGLLQALPEALHTHDGALLMALPRSPEGGTWLRGRLAAAAA